MVVALQFTARSGCSVQVSSTAKDELELLVILNGAGYTPPPLPARRDRVYQLSDIGLLRQGTTALVDDYITKRVPEKACLYHPRHNVFAALGQGLVTTEYARPAEVDVLDRGKSVTVGVTGNGPILVGQGVTVNNSQPYPVYGWLEVRWVHPVVKA
jgi:hypothetical protein